MDIFSTNLHWNHFWFVLVHDICIGLVELKSINAFVFASFILSPNNGFLMYSPLLK